MSATHWVVISLGSNIDKELNLPAAVRLLAHSANVVAVSSVYETPAVGTRYEQSSYFNAAVLVETELSATVLKDELLSDIERQLARRRTADKFAPRTIDLDVTLFDDATFEYTPADGRPRHIPDPDLVRYAHIALPVADLLPDTIHPETGESVRSIADRLRVAAGNTIQPRPDIDLWEIVAADRSTH